MRIAVLGPEGTFSHELALTVYGGAEDEKDEIVLCPTIGTVFTEIAGSSNECTGIVPVENSEAGGVGETLDGLMKNDCHITAEYYLRVRHHFAAAGPGPVEVPERIYAHPQSHEQCSRFIDSLGVPVIHTVSNAASAEKAAGDRGSAAITSARAAGIHGLGIIREDVQNSDNNVTRFLSIEKGLYRSGYPGGCGEDGIKCKCSILTDPGEDRPGLLYAMTGIFAAYGINLSRIESRPSKRGIGNYVFFIDFDLTAAAEDVLGRLGEITGVKELGCYPCARTVI